MRGKTKYIIWNGKEMTVREIIELEKIPIGTMKSWCARCNYDPVKLRNKVEGYKRKGKNKRTRKLYKYKDGRKMTAYDIRELEPHLSVAMIRYRYRTCDRGDFDAIFAPLGENRYTAPKRIDKRHFAGLGKRRDISTVKGPSDYEKQLWGK